MSVRNAAPANAAPINAAPSTQRPVAGCVHHWLIEPPDEELSRGRCSRCGAARTFQNGFHDPHLETIRRSFNGREVMAGRGA